MSFYVAETSPVLHALCARLTKQPVRELLRICERFGPKEEDVRRYDVYRVRTEQGDYILKKADEREQGNYARYLDGLPAPCCYGSCQEDGAQWLLLEWVEGPDLRDMTEELAAAAAASLAAVQNAWWGCGDTDRFAAYRERIWRRGRYVESDPLLGPAYRLFLERQDSCPRTLSNGDFLPWNALAAGDGVCIIDWGFGGVMPYALDIARFIAHANEERATFPFYMTEGHKRRFVEDVYRALVHKPDPAQYRRDIQLALLNEYVEFMEAQEDESGWYRRQAEALAAEIMTL